MKNIRFFFICAGVALTLSACSVFKKGEGCPTNGKNVGAEKIIDGSGVKNTKKAKKFKA